MTTTTPSRPPDADSVEIVLLLLEWLDRRDASPETASEAFEILKHHRRRVLLRVVQSYDDDLTLADLAEEVAVQEFDREITDISAETVAEVYTSIYHDHLPRLVEAGLLEYEQERDLVSPGAL